MCRQSYFTLTIKHSQSELHINHNVIVLSVAITFRTPDGIYIMGYPRKLKSRWCEQPTTISSLDIPYWDFGIDCNITDMLAACTVTQQDIPRPLLMSLASLTFIRLTHHICWSDVTWQRQFDLPSCDGWDCRRLRFQARTDWNSSFDKLNKTLHMYISIYTQYIYSACVWLTTAGRVKESKHTCAVAYKQWADSVLLEAVLMSWELSSNLMDQSDIYRKVFLCCLMRYSWVDI